MDSEYSNMARLVASKLTKEELIHLAKLLDEDNGYEFCYCIQEECSKIAPELYVNLENEIAKGEVND